MTPRAKVIEDAVLIEQSVSEIIAGILSIDLQGSKVLGDYSGAITFFQKLSLLAEMDTFKKNEKLLLEVFAQIRNKFAHSADIDSYSKCLNRLQIGEKLQKLFNHKFPLPLNELDAKDLYDVLHNTIKGIIDNKFHLMYAEAFIDDRANVMESTLDGVFESIEHFLKTNSSGEELLEHIFQGKINEMLEHHKTLKEQYRILIEQNKEIKMLYEDFLSKKKAL